jgi:Bacterial regulatory helix-turn-helix proteins, AraC family
LSVELILRTEWAMKNRWIRRSVPAYRRFTRNGRSARRAIRLWLRRMFCGFWPCWSGLIRMRPSPVKCFGKRKMPWNVWSRLLLT